MRFKLLKLAVCLALSCLSGAYAATSPTASAPAVPLSPRAAGPSVERAEQAAINHQKALARDEAEYRRSLRFRKLRILSALQ